MLTKSDLQQIGNVVDERLKPIENRLGNVENRLGNIEGHLKVVKKDVSQLKKTLSIVIKNYDEADVKLSRRVSRIENHLSLPET